MQLTLFIFIAILAMLALGVLAAKAGNRIAGAPFRLWQGFVHRGQSIVNACNAASNPTVATQHDTAITLLADAAIARNLLVKIGTDGNHCAVCTASDIPIGTTTDAPDAAEVTTAVHLLGRGITQKCTANAAITVGSRVFAAASGKIQTGGGNFFVGIALTAAGADGDVIEVNTRVAGQGGGVMIIPITLASITGAGDVLTNVVMQFAGTIVRVTAAVQVAVTTGSKLATLNLEIGTTNVTGGVVALTSANCTPIGALVEGTAVTAANSFVVGDTFSVEAASVTAFSEGVVDLYVQYI